MPVNPYAIGGRLSLLSNVPVPIYDLVGKSRLYYTPYGGRTPLWSGSAWVDFTLPEIYLDLAGLTANALYDVFIAYHATTPFLELQIWAASGKVITGASAATPVVVTSSGHGLSNGDEVYIEGVRDGNPDALQVAPNGAWIVASAGTTFALANSVGSATYFRGGYFSARLAAKLLGTQDGIPVLASDPTRRYVGTIRMTGATTTEDSRLKRFVWNAFNQAQRQLLSRWPDPDVHDVQNVPVDTPSVPTVGYRIWNNGGGAVLPRVEFILGLAGDMIDIGMRFGFLGASSAHVAAQPGLDGTPRPEFMTASNQLTNSSTYGTSTMHMRTAIQPGYHFADIMEAEVNNQPATLFQGITEGSLWA